jgi:hypothetical protein
MKRAMAHPTRLDALRRRFVHGELDVDAFERAAAELRASGHEHDPEPLPVAQRELVVMSLIHRPIDDARRHPLA